MIDIVPSRAEDSFGIAFDSGTPTAFGYLMSMKTGEMITIVTMTNPQVLYVEDVISRIAYCLEGDENKRRMGRCLRD